MKLDIKANSNSFYCTHGKSLHKVGMIADITKKVMKPINAVNPILA